MVSLEAHVQALCQYRENRIALWDYSQVSLNAHFYDKAVSYRT